MEGMALAGELVLSFASPLLVFLATVLGFYFTFKRDTRKTKLDEIQFIVDEHHKARMEIKDELIAVKDREREWKRKEAECQRQLDLYRQAIVRIRRTREIQRGIDDE